MLNGWCKMKGKKKYKSIHYHGFLFLEFATVMYPKPKKRSTDLMLLTLQITAEKKRTGGPIHTTKGEEKKTVYGWEITAERNV